MPRGKELQQLPMANTLPGMGDDNSKYSRESLGGITGKDRPKPAEARSGKKQ
ncbi:hypothetical protein [Mesobacillus zeae]|uniref:hypothetical protein n=1 Tax=Mesobacillus zeae TaxID=1917180 RepID=UPI0015E657F5|nr:hypothetical protein [Mesobacillus zeae]